MNDYWLRRLENEVSEVHCCFGKLRCLLDNLSLTGREHRIIEESSTSIYVLLHTTRLILDEENVKNRAEKL